MFTFKHFSLLNFHCLTYSAMSLKDDSLEIKIMIECTGCLKNHENEQQGPLSKFFSSSGACMEWKGHFLKPSYQGQLVIKETVDGDYNFDLMFGSSSTMAGELDNFTRNLTDQAYSLLLSSSPCGEKWEKRQLGFLEANETIEGVDDMAVAQSVRLLHCPEEPCLLLVDELDCADLVNDTFTLSMEIIIVLAVAGLIFVVIVICIPIIYCCIKSRFL